MNTLLILLIVFYLLAYAVSKAITDVRTKCGKYKTQLWHVFDTNAFLTFAGGQGVLLLLIIFNNPGRVLEPTMENLVWILIRWFSGGAILWWLAQVPFEMAYSWYLTGQWYADDTRTLPVEWLSSWGQAWITEKLGFPVKFGQVRFNGWHAYAWDGFKLVTGAILLLLWLSL